MMKKIIAAIAGLGVLATVAYAGLVGDRLGIGDSTYQSNPPASGAAIKGNVGIGTTNPQKKLQVIGDAEITGTITSPSVPLTTDNLSEGTTNRYDRTVSISSGSGIDVSGTYPSFTISNTQTSAIWGNITGDITEQTDLDEILAGKQSQLNNSSGLASAINDEIGTGYAVFNTDPYFAGNVGIGSNAPAFKLDVAGTVNAGALYVGGAPYIGSQWTTVSPGIEYSEGNVGIGSAVPAFKLDVAGTVNAGALYVGGYPYIGSQWTTNVNDIFYLTGNVGVGSTIPQQKIDVLGTVKATFFSGDGTDLTGVLHSFTEADTLDSVVGRNGTTTKAVSVGTTTVGASLLVPSGNVGIGTNAPGANLSVGGGVAIGTTMMSLAPPTDGLIVVGNVGLGTSSPVARLQVAVSEGAYAYGTGGDIVYNLDTGGGVYYRVHQFTTTGSQNFVAPISIGTTQAEYLIVAAGGAGGWSMGGGGGGGGVLSDLASGCTFTPGGTYEVVVGDNVTNQNGQASSFCSFTANGGGAGGWQNSVGTGATGGNGGGGSAHGASYLGAAGNQGYYGGQGWSSEYCGGGGGSYSGSAGAGGTESGGAGSTGSSNATAGTNGLGGGGGGSGGNSGNSGKGGSGTVIIRYVQSSQDLGSSIVLNSSGDASIGNTVSVFGSAPSFVTGNFGIGSSVPTQKLDVTGTATSSNFYTAGNVGIGTTSLANKVTVIGGNVGIGTVTTVSKLTVLSDSYSYGSGGDTVTNISSGGKFYRVHKFTSVGAKTFTAPVGIGTTQLQVLVVAGGGGGGTGNNGGGGGAGGGDGSVGSNGGSGGGGGYNQAAGGISTATPPGLGNSGAQGDGAPPYTGGGGGGAGAVGGCVPGPLRGCGAAGVSNSITGSSVVYAAGGSGGNNNTAIEGGSSGIGGDGASGTLNATAGDASTGSGGGGCQTTHSAAAGGSGIVIVRYEIPTLELALPQVANLIGSVSIGKSSVAAGTLDVQGVGTTSAPTFRLLDVDGVVKSSFLDSGNVGIGTSAPRTRLEVSDILYSTGNIGVGTSAPQAKLDVQGGAYIGVGTAYTQIETDGTLYFGGAATVFEDLQVVLNSATAVNAPSITSKYGSRLYTFSDEAVNEDQLPFTAQLTHSYKEGSNVTPHVHFTGEDTTACNFVWDIDYRWTNYNVGIGTSDANATVTVANSGTADLHNMAAMPAISGSGKTISSIITGTLYRNSTNADDTCDGKSAYLLQFDLHYEQDTIGSRQTIVK